MGKTQSECEQVNDNANTAADELMATNQSMHFSVLKTTSSNTVLNVLFQTEYWEW